MRRNNSLDIFGLSLLDTVTCGLGGAIILMILMLSQVKPSADVSVQQSSTAAQSGAPAAPLLGATENPPNGPASAAATTIWVYLLVDWVGDGAQPAPDLKTGAGSPANAGLSVQHYRADLRYTIADRPGAAGRPSLRSRDIFIVRKDPLTNLRAAGAASLRFTAPRLVGSVGQGLRGCVYMATPSRVYLGELSAQSPDILVARRGNTFVLERAAPQTQACRSGARGP